MHVELVELLRCVQPHEETWLVASIDQLDDREIVRGTLGCPVCHAEYPVRDRMVYFASRAGPRSGPEPNVEQAFRIAAALALTEASAIAVLHGDWASHARLVRSVSPAQLVAVNPPAGVDAGDGVNVIWCRIAPLARQKIDGVAIEAEASAPMIASLFATLRSGGRALAPVALALPPELTELTRDEAIWIAERRHDDVFPLRRAGKSV